MEKDGDTMKRILILTQGFIYVGDWEKTEDGDKLTNAYNIRRFGTTAGLGQLVLLGPQQETVLDPIGIVEAPIGSVVCRLHCKESAWTSLSKIPD